MPLPGSRSPGPDGWQAAVVSETPAHAPDPVPVQALVSGLSDALSAARAGNLDGFDGALAELGRGGARRPAPDQVGLVVGLALGELLERTHPDGIDSDDAEQVVERCLRTNRPWYPMDEDQLLRALAGALRIDTYSGPDAVTVGARPALLAHGLLLVADLLQVAGEPWDAVLAGVLDGLRRDGVVEHP